MNICLRPLVLAGLAVMLESALPARTFTILHNFDGTNGAHPYASLVLSSNVLYGTTGAGGLGAGVIFRINIDGSGFTSLHSFEPSYPNPVFPDLGLQMMGGLVLSGTTLYGTTVGFEKGSGGTIYAMQTDGTGFTNLYSFSPTSGSGTNADGAHPHSALVLADGRLYGTTPWGGSSGNGTIFAINTDGSDFKSLYTFSGGSDGAQPKAGLIVQSNILYGAAYAGGDGGGGTLFSIKPDGTDFQVIYTFYPSTNASAPYATLTVQGDTLYGTTVKGDGAVFKVRTDGSDFKILHAFSLNEASSPYGGVVLSNDVLYGVTITGPIFPGVGALYELDISGTNYDAFYSLPEGQADLPYFALTLGSNALYGVTSSGGPFLGVTSHSAGTVFSMSPEPPPPVYLTIGYTNAWFGPGVVMTWPTNVPGFHPHWVYESTNVGFDTSALVFMVHQITNGRVVGVWKINHQFNFFRLENSPLIP